MKEQFLNSLKEALEIEDRDIDMTDKFRDYEEWSSLGRLSIIAMLDEEYSVQIEDEKFKTLETVGDLYNEVTARAGTSA